MKALAGQTVLDIAIQEAGSIEAAYALALANGVSITDEMSGTVTTVDVVKQAVVDYYTAKNLAPSSAISKTNSDEGIFTDNFQSEFS